ncbi:MAG: peptidoglycan-binding protein [Patescibacteria group bacterium]|nr:peptidoglycan-binding protein [Patescibacteria group bacterium]
MQTVTTKAIAKVAAVATGLAMATSMLSLAPIAHAAALTSAQVQSILSLLTSFGADATTIANVQASLTGGTPSSTTTTTTTTTCSFTRDLTMRSTGAEVTMLQQALINGGYSIPAGATGYFGAQTRAAVVAWQKAMGVTPAAGYFGPKSRAAFKLSCSGSTSTSTTTTTTGTGTGLKVMLSPTSPNGTVLVTGQGIGDLADFTFTNPTSAPINVTGLTFNRTGVSNDSTLTNVYLYNGVTRITDSAGVSASAFTYSDPVALFTVPAGGTYTVSVRSDIATGSSGQQIGVSLVSVSSSGTLDSSVSFPIMSGYQTVSAATMATVNYAVNPTPSAATTISPSNDYPVWQDTITVSTNPVKLSSIKFTNLGSIDSQYLTTLRLYIDGVQVGNTVASMSGSRSVTFDLSAAPVTLSTQSHIMKVLANIGAGGASRTIQMSVQRSSDGMFVDSQLNQPVTPTYNSTTFSAASTGVITLNSASASGVSVSRNPSSPSQNIAVGASSVNWASFDMLASGESVKVSDLYVYASSTTSGGALAGVGGLNNGKIMVNGVQIGSTKDIGSLVANKTDFALGSSLILPAGQVTTVMIYGDAQDTAGTNFPSGSTVVVSLAANTSNAQGTSSLTSTGVPNGTAGTNDVSGNSITVSSSALTATKATGYGNQTVIAGANNAKLGSFTLSAGSTEGINVNTIVVTMSSANAASITNLTLKDDATGNTLGSVQTTPSTSNSFSVSFDVPVSSTKTFDIYGNVLSGANAGTIVLSVGTGTTGSGDSTNTSTSVGAAVALQTITLGTGTLSVTTGAGDPVSNNVLAGASSVMVGEFNFAAANSSYTVNNLVIKIPNGAATSVTSVSVAYKDVNGAAHTATQAVTTSASAPYATATFTGLGMYVPMNDSANLDVYVGTPTIASGATSGAAINVSLGTGATVGDFQAVNSAGTATTQINGGVAVASNGTFYVRKSIPTFAMLSTGVTVPSTGTPIYKFSISADPAGAIEWTHLVFNLSTTTASLTNLYLTDDASGVSLTDSGVYATTTGTTATFDLGGNSTSAKYAQVAAGATKTYDLYGTVAGFTTGATVTISLASDSGAIANEKASPYAAGNTVWSDRSATSHTTATTDWTNGYLLKNFTSNATTYSK